MFLGRRLLRSNTLRHNVPRLRAAYATQDPYKNLASLAERLKATDDRSTIHYIYPTFVEDLRRTYLSAPIKAETLLQKQDISGILQKLASSGRPEDLLRIEEIFNDLEVVFNIPPSLELYASTIETLAKTSPEVAWSFVKKLQSFPGNFTPHPGIFLALLESALEKTPFQFAQNVVSEMSRLGCRPTAEVALAVTRAYWKSQHPEQQAPTPESLTPLFDLFETWRIPYIPAVETLIIQFFEEEGLHDHGSEAASVYAARFPATSGMNAWANKITDALKSSGIKGAIQVAKQSPGFEAHLGLRHILQSSRSASDIETAERELGVKADVRHWTTVISNAARADDATAALEVYNASKGAGIVPDAGLIAPIIRRLARQPPDDSVVDQALALYNDLRDAFPPSTSPQFSTTVSGHSAGPDADIFHGLFRLLSRATDMAKFYPIVDELIEDMTAYEIPTDSSAIAASRIVLGIQRSTSSGEALRIYNEFKQPLDEEGYAVVLNAFAKKEHGEFYIPYLPDYFDIVKDMTKAGLPVTTKVYTILLTQIGNLATRLQRGEILNEDFKDDLITATRQTHDQLSLDASISPDTPVLSQLINTYQRLGCFGDAYRVWELMYLIGNFNHTTVTNILDGCGFANDVYTANAIWRKLTRDGFKFNLNNWNTWVECLCRCGQFDMARKVVMQDMGAAGVQPTLDTLQVLLSFARKRGGETEGELLAQIEEVFPSLYSELNVSSSPNS